MEQELPFCACGCGERVKSRGGRYLRGHNNPGFGDAELLTCLNPTCGKQKRVPRWRVPTWRYCRDKCRADAERRPRSKNRLQARCAEYIRANAITVVEFCERAGISHSSYYAWTKDNKSTTSGKNLERLAAFFSIPVEQAVREAGGSTSEDRRASLARRNIDAGLLTGGNTPAARRKAVAKQQGRTRSPEAREKARAAMKDSPAAHAARARLLEWKSTPHAPLVSHLMAFLARHPSPTQADVSAWIDRIAAASGTPREVVLAACRPHLRRRDLSPKGGRPRKTDRLRMYLDLEASWPRKSDGRAADGLFQKFQKLVARAEGKEYSVEVLKRWVYEQVPSARRRPGAARSKRAAA